MNAFLAQHLQLLLREAMNDLPSSALLLVSGEPLFVRATSPLDVGTLPGVGRTVQQYLNLKSGERSITNDWGAGNSEPQDITLVSAFALSSSSQPDFLFVSRVKFRPRLTNKAQHFMRIPPTPFGHDIEGIVATLEEMPSAPEKMRERILDLKSRHELAVTILKSGMKQLFASWKKSIAEDFFKLSQTRHLHKLEELPFNAVNVSRPIDNGNIVLRLENKSTGLTLNFTGTELPPQCRLTSSMTSGICLSSLNAHFGIETEYNAGQFRNVNVQTPAHSSLDSQTSKLDSIGILRLVPEVAELVVAALTTVGVAPLAESPRPAFMEFEFSNGLHFFERLNGGTGATPKYNGLNGFDLWRPFALEPSIEEIESHFPLQILRSEIREGSGGAGLFTGGQGLRRSYLFLKDATLRWSIDTRKTHGFKGGSAGDETKLTLHRVNGEIIDLNAHGELEIKKDESLTLLTAGGGGYGIKPTEDL